MTRRNIRFVRLGWTVALVAVLALGAGTVRALGRRSWRQSQTGTQTGTTTGTTGQTQTTTGQAPPASQPQQPRGRLDGPGPGRGGPGGTGWQWWNDPDVRKELALRDDQVHRIDKLVDDRARSIQVVVDDYNAQRAALDKMMSDRTVDDAVVQHQIRMTEASFGEINVSRFMMLYRISRVLNDDQNKKLTAIRDRHGRGGEPHPHPFETPYK